MKILENDDNNGIYLFFLVSFLFSISIIFYSQDFTDNMIDRMFLSGKFMANERLISACSFYYSLNFNSFVKLIT